MNKLISRLVKGFLCVLCLSSCTVVKDPVSFSYVDINTGVKAGRDIDVRTDPPNTPKANADQLTRIKGALGDEEVTPPVVVVPTPGVKMEVCSKFVPPNLPALPRLTERQMEDMAKLPPDRFNEALLIHMKTMYRYGKAAQIANAEALKKHLSTCRQAVVQ